MSALAIHPLHRHRNLAVAAVFLALSIPCESQRAATPAAVQPTPSIPLAPPEKFISSPTSNQRLKFQNGTFFVLRGTHLQLWPRDGRSLTELELHPPASNVMSPGIPDLTIEQDGSIVASYIWLTRADNGRKVLSYLIHYDRQGEILDTIDMGDWRAYRVCITEDQNIWTISQTPIETRPAGETRDRALRNYKFGSGLVQSIVPGAALGDAVQHGDQIARLARSSAIDCSDNAVHALLADEDGPQSLWIESTSANHISELRVEDADIHATANELFLKQFVFLDKDTIAAIFQKEQDSNNYTTATLLQREEKKSLELKGLQILMDRPASDGGINNGEAQPATAPSLPLSNILGIDRSSHDVYVVYETPDGRINWSAVTR